MTVRLLITSSDKDSNETRRFTKYLAHGEAFGVALQEIPESRRKTAPPPPEYVCTIRNTNDQIMLMAENSEGLVVNDQRVEQSPLKSEDVIWLNTSVNLTIKAHVLSGSDIFKAVRSAKDSIIIPVARIEKAVVEEQVGKDPLGHEVGGYYFEDVLEYGNMGLVYKAIQKSLRRPVTIKTIPVGNEKNQKMMKRFMNIASFGWKLNHPYIVQIYDSGTSPEFKMNYVVMEYVEGDSLESLLSQKGRLDVELACKFMSQLASALSFAHRQSIIHRDVNPANILITPNDYIKLVGLALSKVLDPDQEKVGLTMAGETMGTVGYISPEQAQDASSVDFRTDIYSLGVVFYRCLCGQLPYDADIFKSPSIYKKALWRKIQNPPHIVNPLVPEALSNVVMKCLEPEAAKRYQKADEVLDDIKMYTEAVQLTVAQKRVRAMFPPTPKVDGFEFHVTFEPMEEIGGDFYDFVPLKGNKLGIVIGDVTGHGIEAAVVMGMVKSVVKLIAKTHDNASQVLEASNKELSTSMDGTTFTTIGYSILDTQNKVFYHARAGHNPLILYNPDRHPTLMTYTPKGAILGVPWPLNCEDAKIPLQKGDIVLQYTDGIIEAKSKEEEEFGLERLCEVIEQSGQEGLKTLISTIRTKVAEFSKESTDADDVTIVAFQVL